MSNLVLGLHVLFAALLVGGQALLFFAVTPSTWLIDDEPLRRRVTAVVARRFAAIALVSIAGLLATGLVQFYRDEFVPPAVREAIMDFRFGFAFTAKMALLTALIAMIAFHGAYFGRRIARVSAAVEAGEAEQWELEHQRRNSLLFSALMLLVSIVLIFLGAALGNHGWAHVPR